MDNNSCNDWDDILTNKLIEPRLITIENKLNELIKNNIGSEISNQDKFETLINKINLLEKENRQLKDAINKVHLIVENIEKAENTKEKLDKIIKFFETGNSEDKNKSVLPSVLKSNPTYAPLFKNYVETSKEDTNAYVEYNRLRNMKLRNHDNFKFMPDLEK